ncbi:MAG: hypothetical protein V8R85_03950 [Frisingicoccus sp.]
MRRKRIRKHKRIKRERKKTITILLTGYSDWFSRFIRIISRSGYSHASLSIDGTEEVFYSFNGKGVAVEQPKNGGPVRGRNTVSVFVSVCRKVYVTI